MEQQDKNKAAQLPNEASSELVQELKNKYGVDEQEALNAVIAANNNRSEAEAYLKERTEKK